MPMRVGARLHVDFHGVLEMRSPCPSGPGSHYYFSVYNWDHNLDKKGLYDYNRLIQDQLDPADEKGSGTKAKVKGGGARCSASGPQEL